MIGDGRMLRVRGRGVMLCSFAAAHTRCDGDEGNEASASSRVEHSGPVREESCLHVMYVRVLIMSVAIGVVWGTGAG